MSIRYRTLLYVGAGAVLLIVLVVFFVGSRFRTEEGYSGTLTIWSLEPESAWSEAISGFVGQFPKVRVAYVQKPEETYEAELLTALASGSGPDIFAIHHTWVPKHADKIAPMPEELITVADFEESFVDIAEHDLIAGGRIYGVPLYVDTLALFYNKTLFNTHGITKPPETWEEFNEVV